jgi:hypothetical protein
MNRGSRLICVLAAVFFGIAALTTLHTFGVFK